MLWSFIKLEWRSFTRSASFGTNLALKIFIGFGILFYSALFLMLGVLAFYEIQDNTGQEPLTVINSYLIYWWAFDIIFRYFAQNTPVMRVKPLLTLAISKKRITHYLLGKSGFTFFNIYPLFFLVPFSVTLLSEGYSVVGVIAWFVAMRSITYFNNYLNLAVNNKTAIFAAVALVFVGAGVAQYFGFFDITLYTTPIFESFFQHPWVVLFVVLATGLMYQYDYNHFYKALYLDEAVQESKRNFDSTDYSWLSKFGLMGTFLTNDLRLILRNKRSKNTLWLTLFSLFYGFFFFNDPIYMDKPIMMVFAGIIITGGFMFTFGGFVPSWDSSHYPFMMSQSIRYREYLSSKWWLMNVVTFIMIIVSTFYLYFGVEVYMAIFSAGIYNIGINAYITLLSGAYIKTPIDLESASKPFGGKNAFNVKTVLLTIPKLVLPALIFGTFNFFFDSSIGFFSVCVTGLLGLLFRNAVFKQIENIYKEEKYETIYAYKQKN